MPDEMECLTSAHSVEAVLVVSTPDGLECNDVGGVELHMITKRRKESSEQKNEMARGHQVYSQFFSAFIFYIFFFVQVSERHYERVLRLNHEKGTCPDLNHYF